MTRHGWEREAEQIRYAQALAYATAMHQGQARIGGAPYIQHPIAVAQFLQEKGYGVDYQIAGLFHDLLEDTAATPQRIRELGGWVVLAAVQRLTKSPAYRMIDYVAGIRQDPLAFAVKGADRLHNLQCAKVAPAAFRLRYIQETLDWYMDFLPEIPQAVAELAATLPTPLYEQALSHRRTENGLPAFSSAGKER